MTSPLGQALARADPSLQSMGTTLTALLWSGSQLGLVHIGDSRAYLVRDGEVFQITHDHTMVQSLLDDGKISDSEVASHPQRWLLLRALAADGSHEPDLQLREARAGDRYLLSSDGLHQVAAADAMARVLLLSPIQIRPPVTSWRWPSTAAAPTTSPASWPISSRQMRHLRPRGSGRRDSLVARPGLGEVLPQPDS